MKKIAIILITFWSLNFGIAQDNIEVPVFEKVQVDYDLRDYVTISIDRKGTIKLEEEVITIDELKPHLFEVLSYKTKYKGLRLPISIIELVVDKDLKFKKLNSLLIELRKLGCLKVHFVCNSETEKSVKGLKTTGFLYNLNSIKNSESISFEVRKFLNAELKRAIKKKNIDENTKLQTLPPPPPPPPPPVEIIIAELKSGGIDITVKVIEIKDKYFVVDGQQFTSEELKKMMRKWNLKEPIAYIIQPSKNCTYENFLTPFLELHYILKSFREISSKNKYEKNYQELNYSQKQRVRNKFPFFMVIDDEY